MIFSVFFVVSNPATHTIPSTPTNCATDPIAVRGFGNIWYSASAVTYSAPSQKAMDPAEAMISFVLLLMMYSSPEK